MSDAFQSYEEANARICELLAEEITLRAEIERLTAEHRDQREYIQRLERMLNEAVNRRALEGK
jgi:hemerythrin-like domain-containing protein